MSSGGAGQINRIRHDLACLECGYNLRGLRGDEVTCPECGTTFDVAELIMRQWIGPWQRAPGYGRLLGPVVVFSIGAVLAMYPLIIELGENRFPVFSLGVLGVTAVPWAILMHRLARGGSEERVWLALLAHLLLLGYAGGAIGLVVAGVSLILDFDPLAAPAMIAAMVVCGAIVYGCRRGEIYIANRCIRRYLKSESKARDRAGD